MLDQATLARLQRGLTGLAAGMLKIEDHWQDNDVFAWIISSTMSDSRHPQKYRIEHYLKYAPHPWSWHCTCPDYEKRRKPCKHILVAQIAYQQRVDA